jgi:hypothetical protein
MGPETRSRLLREYLWFAVMLMVVLMSSAIQEHGETAMNRFPSAGLTVISGSAAH